MKSGKERSKDHDNSTAMRPVWGMDEAAWEDLRSEMEKDAEERVFAIYGAVVIGGVLAEIETDTDNEMSDIRLYVKGFDDGDSAVPEDPTALDECYESMSAKEILAFDSFGEYKHAVEKLVLGHGYYSGRGILMPGYESDWDKILAGANGVWE